MKRKIVYMGLLLGLLVLFSGCDPVYPMGKLRISPIGALEIGEEIEINLSYPSGAIGVIGWKNQTIEIVKNPNVIAVNGLKVKGLESGTATIKVSATTILAKGAYDDGYEEKVYSVQVKITVR